MPWSRASFTIRVVSSWPRLPMFILPPNCMLPSATSLTMSPVCPRVLCFISCAPCADLAGRGLDDSRQQARRRLCDSPEGHRRRRDVDPEFLRDQRCVFLRTLDQAFLILPAQGCSTVPTE